MRGRSRFPKLVLVRNSRFWRILYWAEFLSWRRAGKKEWVPIKPTTMEWWGSEKFKNTYTRTQLPLRLAWEITIHKSHGITIHGKYCVDLGQKELNHGMTYVAFSRETKFSDIGLISPLTGSRLKAINNNQGNKVRIKHEKDLEILSREMINTYEQLIN